MIAQFVLLATIALETAGAPGPLMRCSSATQGPWVKVRDHRKVLAFVAAVRGSQLEFSEGGPFDCGLRLVARCGPDLDGNGRNDLVVHAE